MAKTYPDDEHPDHQHWINRWPAERRIIGRELGANPIQIQDSSNIADKMIGRNNLFKAERIEQLTLVPIELTHHGIAPPRIVIPRRNHCSQAPSMTFATWGNSGIVPHEGTGNQLSRNA
jgi:hypothetical protein